MIFEFNRNLIINILKDIEDLQDKKDRLLSNDIENDEFFEKIYLLTQGIYNLILQVEHLCITSN